MHCIDSLELLSARGKLSPFSHAVHKGKSLTDISDAKAGRLLVEYGKAGLASAG